MRNKAQIKHRAIHLSKISNMKYIHITHIVGAAKKYYQAIRINPDEFKDVIIYLKDFQAFMHFFGNFENLLVTVGRDFEDILYQARIGNS